MPAIAVDASILGALLTRRDELVHAITTAMGSGDWDQVMAPFEGLLVAIKQLEESLDTAKRQDS